jgi:Caspase domain
VAIGSRDGRGMRLEFIVPCILALLLAAPPAKAAKRLALVIGNNAYENVPQLQKALNDADAIAQELSKLGFEVVKAEDVGRRAMSRALVELESKIDPGDTALVYFAGHGFAIDGTNYLLPVDVPVAGPGEEGLVRDASFAANGLSDRNVMVFWYPAAPSSYPLSPEIHRLPAKRPAPPNSHYVDREVIPGN